MTPLDDREIRESRTFYAVTAISTCLWWVGLQGSAAIRQAFLGRDAALWMGALLLPDLVSALFMATGLVWAIGRHPSLAQALAWGTFGGQGYAFLLSIGIAARDPDAAWGVVAMMFSAGVSLAYAIRFHSMDILWGPFRFSTSPSRKPRQHLTRMIRQMASMWAVFLVLIPSVFGLVERALHWHLVEISPLVRWGVAPLVILLASWMGVASGWAMAKHGDGTPLPSDCPGRLVIAGPYRFIRNPMALGGAVQGVMVGLMWQSPLIMTYSIIGGLWWEIMVRHLEERHLAECFGSQYADYRAAVRCWIPRLTPFESAR